MGNSMPLDYNTEEFRQLFGSQWEIISDGKCTKYANTISKEEFVLKLMDYSKTSQNAYRLRQLYSFEQSPRISVLKVNQNHMQILVQDATKDIKTWLSNQFMSAIQSLMVLKKVLQGLLKLRKKYGCFYLTSNMVKVNKNGKILIWINENFEYNSIAYKLPQDQGQQTMYMKVLSFFGSLLPFSLELKNIKTLNQGILFVNKMLLQKALSQVDYPNSHKYGAHHKSRFVKNSYNQSLQSLDYSKGVRSNKSYKVLITETSKGLASPKIGSSTKKYANKNPQCFQSNSKSRQTQQFCLKLNPVTYESHSESVPSNYSQSSKKSSNENKVFLENNLFKGRNDLLFISMGAGQSPKNNSSRADTEEQVKDSKAPSYQKNLAPLQIPSFNSKHINLTKTADDTFSQVRQVLDNFDIDSDTKQAQMRESGQLSSPMRREIHSQLSKIL